MLWVKRLFRKTFLLVFIVFVLMVTACSANKSQNGKLPEKKPLDFGFVLNYGVEAKNQLDTEKGTYTLDMVTEPSVTINLKLSEEEINEIYTLMKKLDILSYPDVFNPKSNTMQTPFSTYSMKIIVDGKKKDIYWKDENVSESKVAVRLRDLINRIHEIVIGKEEYKKLPQPKGGYL
jgi:hypothetical protein